MKGKREVWKIADLKLRPMRQSNGTPEELKALARSWLERAAHDIIVCPSGKVVDGHRRLDGLRLLGETEANVFVTEEELDDSQARQVGLATAIHRADLSGYDKWLACRELLELSPGMQGKDLADFLHLDPSSVTRMLSPSKCIPDWQEALRDGKVTISDIYEASKKSQDVQAGLLAMKLSGEIVNRAELARAGRKPRPAATAVRASKIKVPLVNGATVTISGDEITLEEAIEAAGEAIKNMKAAVAKGLNAKTAMNVWRDVAAAG